MAARSWADDSLLIQVRTHGQGVQRRSYELILSALWSRFFS